MEMNNLFTELEDIHYKYERLASLVSILQQFVAEQVDIVGAPGDSLENTLLEIEIGMDGNNDRLKALFSRKGGAVS